MKIPKNIFDQDKSRYLKSFPEFTNSNARNAHAKLINFIGIKLEPNFKLKPSDEVLSQITEGINLLRVKQGKKAVNSSQVANGFQKLRDIYADLLLYFRGSEKTTLDLDKGLYVHGSTGCGKTLLFKIFKQYTMNVLQINSFQMSSCEQVAISAERKGLDGINEFVENVDGKPSCMYFEDLGVSNAEVKHYGTEVQVISELISRRYRHYEETGVLTHICSNVKPELLEKVYDKRVDSRINKMCNIINLNTLDFRKL